MSSKLTHSEIFPAVERVIYAAAPLTEVICQLRFPPILKIDQTPAEFQDRIRGKFPLFERGQTLVIPADLPPDVAQAMNLPAPSPNHRFKTEDESTTFSLSAEAVALATTSYVRWEDFRALFAMCMEAFVEVYRPSFYSRIGLRYRNSINREKIGLAERPWIDLLSPAIGGELAVPGIEPLVAGLQRRLRMRLPDQSGLVFFQHGLSGSKDDGSNVYLIDFDFYTDAKTEVGNAGPILDHFNRIVGRAFRWSITPVLHEALGPRAVTD
jgi:uncharacterized protein (TIGR04255 family)